MYQVTRHKDDKPAGMLHVMVDQPAPDSKDAGFGMGGSFYFLPGQTLPMSEYAARIVMGDPVMAKKFTVDPPLPVPEPEPEAEPVAEASAEPVPAQEAAPPSKPQARPKAKNGVE